MRLSHPLTPPRHASSTSTLAAKRIARVLVLIWLVACAGEPARTAGGSPFTAGDPASPAAPGVSGNPGAGGDGDTVACTEYAVQTSRVTPQILVVFDRSFSMVANGWAPAVSAIQSVVTEFDQDIEFGFMVFPDIGGFTCTAGTVDVPIKANNAAAIQSYLTSLIPWGNTPTAAALKTARSAIGSGQVSPDEVVPPKYVVLITDGAPNCDTGGVDQAMATACIQEISAMAQDDVRTYVLGYHIGSAAEKDALDRMAAAGGTGDSVHRDIGDQAALVAEFKQIVGAARSCEFQLDQAVTDPNYVSVKIDGALQILDEPDGWQLGKDMQSVALLGSACETLRNGETHTVAVQVECEVIIY